MRRMLHPARRPTGLMVLGCVLLVSAHAGGETEPGRRAAVRKSGREDSQAG